MIITKIIRYNSRIKQIDRKTHLFEPEFFFNLSNLKQLAMDIGDMRTPYHSKDDLFLEENIPVKEPIAIFTEWFKQVKADGRCMEPNAACLATCTKDNFPAARMVLTKGFGKDGFRFFTYYTSRKGQELAENPKAALTFYWEHCVRSVRIEGDVEKLPFSDADNYFSGRPYQSQIGALCSNQSQPIENREALSKIERDLKSKYIAGSVPRPPQWGGYILKPRMIEFWQGQTDRIHDRIRFRHPKCDEKIDGNMLKQGEDGWVYERLCP